MEDPMASWTWALTALIGLLVILTTVLVANRQRRTVSLRHRFGPENVRMLEAGQDRRAVEAALTARSRRRSELNIVPLAEPDRLRVEQEWRRLQEHFVDRPGEAVNAAESLLTRVMQERGYPVGEFDQQADLISVDHPYVVENYRIAHEIHRRNQEQQATTEDLREAMLNYRSLLGDLLHPDRTGADEDTRGLTVDEGDTDQHATDLRREHR
jgi:hypothetical protein